MADISVLPLIERIAAALDRLAPPPIAATAWHAADAFVWDAEGRRLAPVAKVARVDLALLKGLDRQRDILLGNTRRFAHGLPANNALLWGVRGMGKSSLVKAVHAAVTPALALVEIHREDLAGLPQLMELLRGAPRRCLLLCDDLSFEAADASYKSLKAALEGGLTGRPDNVLFYATSNRRHLMARSIIENESADAIHPTEAVEEKVSLSDRFGLWLGFHACSQDEFLAMVDGYAGWLGLPAADRARRHAEAIEWAATRGARSGRVAWQFALDLAGRAGVPLPGSP